MNLKILALGFLSVLAFNSCVSNIERISGYPCDYPEQTDSSGRQCGDRAAIVRLGGRLGGYK